jgi:hypothetical protein
MSTPSEPWSGVGSQQEWNFFVFDKSKGLKNAPCHSEANLAAPTAIGKTVFFAHDLDAGKLYWHMGKIVSNDNVKTKKKSLRIQNEAAVFGTKDESLDKCRDFDTAIAAFKTYRRVVLEKDDLEVECRILDKREPKVKVGKVGTKVSRKVKVVAEAEEVQEVVIKPVQIIRKINDTSAILREDAISKLKPWYTLGSESEWNEFKLNTGPLGLKNVPCIGENEEPLLISPESVAIGKKIIFAHNLDVGKLYWHMGKIVSNDNVKTKKKSLRIQNELAVFGTKDESLDKCRDFDTAIAAFKTYRRVVLEKDDLEVESKISDKREPEVKVEKVGTKVFKEIKVVAEAEVVKEVVIKPVQNIRKINDTSAILREDAISKLKPWYTLGSESEWNEFKLNTGPLGLKNVPCIGGNEEQPLPIAKESVAIGKKIIVKYNPTAPTPYWMMMTIVVNDKVLKAGRASLGVVADDTKFHVDKRDVPLASCREILKAKIAFKKFRKDVLKLGIYIHIFK